MTDLNKKDRILTIVTFSLFSLLITMQASSVFALTFFCCIGLVLFFSDRILNPQKINNRTLFSFFAFACCYQTFYQIFNILPGNGKQLMVASSLAIFLAAVFAATDRTKYPYSVFCIPLICLLDTRVASAYCVLMLSFSIFLLFLESDKSKKKSGKKTKKNNKNAQIKPVTVARISVALSIVALAFCVHYTLKQNATVIENTDYLFSHFKNSFGFTASVVYLLIKLLKNKTDFKCGIIVGLILFIAATVFFTINYGWAFFSLFLVSLNIFLGLICFENDETISSIKDDYRNHKYAFIIGLLCLLQ